ncbi:MAG: hypothetical protein GWP19_05885 [Planctomycetia bacterium]|nr:hypothetical protein [Planctomycetia bacterium]
MRKIFPILLLSMFIFAQTTVNPDISVIGDLVGITDKESTDFSSSGVELAIQGYVNPFARADVYLHKHNDDSPIHLEEAFLSIERGLPLNLGLRAGKFRPDFGKINKEHMHTYYYILPSVPVQSIMGNEMWSSIGIESAVLLPLPWYSNLSFGILQKGISQHHHEHTEEHEEAIVGNALSGRLSNFFELNSNTHLEIGMSYYQEINGSNNSLVGTDYKFKWRPDTYRSFVLQGDYFYKSTSDGEKINAGYTWFNYQFNRIWNAGLIFDFSTDIEEEPYKSIGIFAGFSPVEESSVLRLRLHHECHGNESPRLSLVAQIIWALGPHKPHQF